MTISLRRPLASFHVIVLALAAGGCIKDNVKIQSLTTKTYPPTKPSQVELFVEAPNRASEPLAEITVTKRISGFAFTQKQFAASFGVLSKALQTEAAKLGADAVVGMRRMYAKSTYSGLAVKFTGPLIVSKQTDLDSALDYRVSDVDKPNYGLKENKDYYGLVVGIEKYSNLPDAIFAERDATAVREHLIGLGVPPRNIRILLGPQALKSSLEKYVETWLPSRVGKNSRVFVYFSGHGAPDPKTGLAYLVPWDGDAKFLADTTYSVKRFYKSLNALKAKQVIVFLDACFSGAGGRSVLAKGTRPLVVKVDPSLQSAGKLIVLSASAADEITGVTEEPRHGLFTYYLLKGLNGAAKSSASGLSLQALYDYLKPKVMAEARRENRDQNPQLMSPSLRELSKIRIK